MQQEITIDDAIALIKLKGRVTHQESKEFLEFGRLVKDGLRQLEINLSDVDFIDSMGVGMLIILAEHSKANGCSMHLTGVSGQVERVFNTTELIELLEWDHRLITIESA